LENDSRIRADVALVSRGLAVSRERAQALISGNLVALNGKPLTKSSVRISEEDVLTVLGMDHPYVSRGGLKLEKALKCFGVDPSGQICMDIGASTGGFTDVLLRSGAQKVYAIDVGTGQLDPSIASDARVVSMEHTNARELHSCMFPDSPTLGVMDVSFISIKLILPAAFSVLGAQGRMLTLIKPQFEAGPKHLGKKGIVSDPKAHLEVLRDIVSFVPTLGWQVRALDYSPICGTSGNMEFLADLVPAERCDTLPIAPDQLRALIQAAHKSLK